MYQIYHTWIHLLHHSPLSCPPTIPGIVFPFTYMCTQYSHCIHPPTPFPHHLPLPLVPTPLSRQGMFHPPVPQFCKEKQWHFCFFKIATQGVSLGHFHVYVL
jgi:hypothetical protein